MFKSLLLVISFAVTLPVNALTQSLLNDASQAREWLKLLHYSTVSSRSEIENDSFFLADKGHVDPLAELKATIGALSTPVQNDNPNIHAQCLFPARLLFIKKHNLHPELPHIRCDNYLQWLGESPADSVSIIYADGYLGNPASFYGHILFKVNSGKNEFTSELLNNSLNFGAEVPDNENPLIYILKGLVGGYQAKYTSNHFYRYNINYSEVELRDLWQYELNLSSSKKDLLIAHAWELLSSGYTYYFTNRNCAYHIAKMLELVTEKDLISPSELFVLPITVFNRLSKVNVEADSLIKTITRTESRQNRFRRKHAQLNFNQQEIVEQLIATDEYSSSYSKLEEFEKKQLSDVMIDYYEFRVRQDDSQVELKQRKHRVLLERLKLGSGNNPQWSTTDPTMPHTGQNPSLLRTSIQHNSLTGNSVTIQARPAYFDFLSADAGHLPFSQLSMADLSLRLTTEKIQISKFDLLNIETLNISATGLPGDAGIAWKFRVGNERDVLSDSIVSNEYFIESAVGKAQQYGNLALYTMLEARWQSPNDKSEQILLSPKVGFIYANEGWKTHCYASYPLQVDQSAVRTKLKFGCTQRLTSDYWYDIRINFQKHFSSELGITFSYYL
ncbi:MAG: hypothetical protein ACJASL_003543 [Paraglaciecola sp.]|jgi:hypothetical protein